MDTKQAGANEMLEVYKAVHYINAKIFKYLQDRGVHNDDLNDCALTAITDGWSITIKFMGTQIWNSEEDERAWDDDSVESLAHFLYRQMVELQEQLDGVIRSAI